MTQRFDIFRQEPNGQILWRGTAASIEEARSAVARLGAAVPACYLIVDLQTRTQVTIDCRPHAARFSEADSSAGADSIATG